MSQTMEQMRGRLGELITQIRPAQADYDRLMKVWIKAERDATAAYLAMAEIVDNGTFGANRDSLQALMRYHDADIALLDAGHKVALSLRAHHAMRDEIRQLMHKISARLTYSLAADLTSDEAPHQQDVLERQPTPLEKDIIRTVVRSDDPAAQALVQRATADEAKKGKP